MRKTLAVVTLPDGSAISTQTLLQAALYFDVVFTDCHHPTRTVERSDRGGYVFSLESGFTHFETTFKDLVQAGVIAPLPRDAGCSPTIPSFSTSALPPSLRRAVARSLRTSATLLARWFTLLNSSALKRRVKSQYFSIRIERPDNPDDPLVEIQIIAQITAAALALNASTAAHAVPFSDHPAHLDMLMEMAANFRSIASALGSLELARFAQKRDIIAQTIMRDTLPPIRVNQAEDILYLRDELKDELEAFRAEVGRLATFVGTNPGDAAFEKDVESTLSQNVYPTLAQLRRRLNKPSRRILAHLVSDWSSIVGGTAVPVAAVVMRNAQLPVAVIAGLATGMSIAALKTMVEQWTVTRDSPLAFLLKSEKRLTRI